MALEFIGNCIFFVIGLVIGSMIMYVGPILIEKLDELRSNNDTD